MMDREALKHHFRSKFTGDDMPKQIRGEGGAPQDFSRALAPIAQRHGVLDRLVTHDSWRRVHCEGDWHTSSLAADAALLGITILEIEAVYRLTYGGKS